MTKRTLIFDFDGTIADTHHYIVGISNRLAQEFNFKSIPPEEIENLKNKTAQDLIKHLNVPFLKIPAILTRGKKYFFDGINDIQPIDGLKDALFALKSAGVPLGILSSNTKQNILHFLDNHSLNVFDFIHSTSQVWSKNISLKEVIRLNNLNKDAIIYVGDETRDITAARHLGIKIAAVTWGYNSLRALEPHHPDFLLNDPRELLKLSNGTLSQHSSKN